MGPIVLYQGFPWLKICCSQHFSQIEKVLARKFQQVVLYLTLCLICLLIAFANSWSQIRPDKILGLIWIQIVWHPDGIEKIQHPKSKIWHNNKVWRNNKSRIRKSKSWSKYTFSQKFNFWTTLTVLLANDIFVATLHFSSKWLQWLMAEEPCYMYSM